MMTTNAKVQSVLLESPGGPMGKLQFVEYTTGRFAVLRDDTPVNGCEWPPQQLNRGVLAFREMMSGKMTGAAFRN